MLEALLLLGVPAAIVLSTYLWIYARHRYAFPVGYDTPKYLWRSSLVGAKGLGALTASAPTPFRVNADRAGFPILVDAVSSVLRVTPLRLVMVLPAAMAASVGLGAGAFATLGLDRPRWAVAVFVVVVGASANVSRIAGPGYDDNLVLASVVMAAAAVAMHAARTTAGGAIGAPGDRDGAGARTALGAAVLIAAGALIHWVFLGLFVGMLGAVALLCMPVSIRAHRAGLRATRTPSGRLGAILGSAGLLGGLGLLTVLGSEPSPPRLPIESFRLKLGRDVPRYAFPLVGSMAAVGIVALGWPGRAARRWPRMSSGRWLVVVWALSAAIGVALLALGRAVPAHRVVAFAFGIPLLAATGLVAVGSLVVGPGGRARIAVAVAVVTLGVVATTVLAERAWSGTHPWIPSKQFAQASVAGGYLREVGGDAPVVFVVDLGGAAPLASTSEAFHVLRTALPPEVMSRTLVYLGSPSDLLAGRPTLRPTPPTFDRASLQHWPSVRAVLDRHPIALLMPAFHRDFARVVAAEPSWRVAPGLAVVQGPRPSGPVEPFASTPGPTSALRLALLAVAFLCLLAVTGGGWTGVLVEAGWIERIAVAPAFGIATLVLGGVIWDRLGLGLDGGAGAALVAAVAVPGWVTFVLTLARTRRAAGRTVR